MYLIVPLIHHRLIEKYKQKQIRANESFLRGC